MSAKPPDWLRKENPSLRIGCGRRIQASGLAAEGESKPPDWLRKENPSLRIDGSGRRRSHLRSPSKDKFVAAPTAAD
jgi:hypothetical protein